MYVCCHFELLFRPDQIILLLHGIAGCVLSDKEKEKFNVQPSTHAPKNLSSKFMFNIINLVRMNIITASPALPLA